MTPLIDQGHLCANRRAYSVERLPSAGMGGSLPVILL